MEKEKEVKQKDLQPENIAESPPVNPQTPTVEEPPVQAEAPPEEPATTETDTETPKETSTSPNKIDVIIAEFMPDADLSTPEARESAIEELLTRLSNIHNSLRDVVEDEPEFGIVLDDILKGSNVATAFARHYGPEAFSEPVEGEPDYEEYGKYKEQRTNKRKEKEERRKALKSNEEVSLQEIDFYMEEKGLTPEQAQDFFTKADEFFADVFDGKITKKHLAMLEKAFGYEDAVKDAEETGKVAGRNEKIVEQKVKKPVTSGMPEINEGGTPPKTSKKRSGLLSELYG